jgi:hypothetical protein
MSLLQSFDFKKINVKNNFSFSKLHVNYTINTPSNSLIDSTMSPKVKTMEGERVGVCSLVRNTLGVERHVGAPKWGLG